MGTMPWKIANAHTIPKITLIWTNFLNNAINIFMSALYFVTPKCLLSLQYFYTQKAVMHTELIFNNKFFSSCFKWLLQWATDALSNNKHLFIETFSGLQVSNYLLELFVIVVSLVSSPECCFSWRTYDTITETNNQMQKALKNSQTTVTRKLKLQPLWVSNSIIFEVPIKNLILNWRKPV